MLDGLFLGFVVFRTVRAGGRVLARSLHGLVSLVLLVSLFLGLQLDARLRDLLAGIVSPADAAPGLGGRLLVVAGAWYLMRLARTRLGGLLEAAVPARRQRPTLFTIEALRASLLAALVVWIMEPLFEANHPGTPVSVRTVRIVDNWAARHAPPAPVRTPRDPMLDDAIFMDH